MQKRKERAIIIGTVKNFAIAERTTRNVDLWRYFEFVRRQARYGATRHKVGRMKIAATLKPVQSAI